jgi:hypothetical protein
MKYNVALLTAIAVTIVSVRASPVHVQARSESAPTDPFVNCMQQTHPQFPRGGNPTLEELNSCFAQGQPKSKRAEASIDSEADFNSTQLLYGSTDNSQHQPRGIVDSIQVLGQRMGIGQRPTCQEESGLASKIHDEFVWAHDVSVLAEDLCKAAASKIEETGLNADGGVGYAYRQLTNAHDDQDNILKNGRHLLLTMAIRMFPPTAIAQDEIREISQGVYTLCTAGIQRIVNPTEGCTEQVDWYISQKMKWGKEMAALGGAIDVFRGGANSPIASLRVGFSEDTN